MKGPGPEGQRIYVKCLPDGSFDWDYCRSDDSPAFGEAVAWFWNIPDARAFVKSAAKERVKHFVPPPVQGELLRATSSASSTTPSTPETSLTTAPTGGFSGKEQTLASISIASAGISGT